jgi:hypothetical protein
VPAPVQSTLRPKPAEGGRGGALVTNHFWRASGWKCVMPPSVAIQHWPKERIFMLYQTASLGRKLAFSQGGQCKAGRAKRKS